VIEMNDEFRKDQEAAALWREAKDAWRGAEPEGEPVDFMTLAAYLDGGLSEEERAALEARIARDPALLAELAALRGIEPQEPPAGLILRAQGLVREAPKAETAKSGGLAGLFAGGFLRPLGWGSAFAALLVACLLSFELGRSGLAAAEEITTAEQTESVPFDISGDLFL
jgi:anti-sigma factor RsiW